MPSNIIPFPGGSWPIIFGRPNIIVNADIAARTSSSKQWISVCFIPARYIMSAAQRLLIKSRAMLNAASPAKLTANWTAAAAAKNPQTAAIGHLFQTALKNSSTRQIVRKRRQSIYTQCPSYTSRKVKKCLSEGGVFALGHIYAYRFAVDFSERDAVF